MDGYLEASSDGCTFATASPRTPAYYRDGVRHELDGDVDIVAISPDGLAGIIYQDEGGTRSSTSSTRIRQRRGCCRTRTKTSRSPSSPPIEVPRMSQLVSSSL